MIHGLHHPAISTPDIERAIRFYCDTMGGELVKKGQWPSGNGPLNERLGLPDSAAKTAMVKVGAAFIELFEFSMPRAEAVEVPRPVHLHGITHLCFVVDDCGREFERLSSVGVAFHAPPLQMPTGAFFTYGRDPDGNIFELVEIPAGADFPSNYPPDVGD